jgi:acyl carrier protein
MDRRGARKAIKACRPFSQSVTAPSEFGRRNKAREHLMSGETVDVDACIRSVLVDILGVSRERAATFDDDTGLFGSLPELDSMAVASLLTEVEDRLGIMIDDDEVDGEMLESFGSLKAFAEMKVAG